MFNHKMVKTGLFLIIGLVGVLMVENAYAQLAKINRETVKMTVQPEVILQGNQFSITLERYQPEDTFRLSIFSSAYDLLHQEELTISERIFSKTVDMPEGTKGQINIVLESRINEQWAPLLEKTISIIPGFWKNIQSTIDDLQQLETQYEDENPTMLRSVWALLAYGEDLMERAKSAGPYDAWDLQRRLSSLQSKTQAIEKAQNPYEKNTGYMLRGYRSPLNQEMQLYSLFVPHNYSNDQTWPMVVMLHGAWSNHHLALRRVMGLSNRRGENDDAAKRSMPKLPNVPYLVVAPNGHETMSYEGFAEDDVWRVMNEVRMLYNVNPNRIYLTGLSMGGAGTAKLAMHKPDVFAAIAPVCGFFGVRARENQRGQKPEYLQRLETMSSAYEMAENALHIPAKIMHGDSDPVVPVSGSKEFYQKLNSLGYEAELEIYEGVDHAAWVPAYENARIFDWFSNYERDPAPKKVILKTGNPTGGKCYWLKLDEPEEIRKISEIRGELKDDNLEILTRNVVRFTLDLPEEWEVKSLIIDAQNVSADQLNSSNVRFIHRDGEWQISEENITPPLLPPRKGILSLFDERHIYVYGQQSNDEINAEAQRLAILFSLPGGNSDVRWEVLPENDLDQTVMKDNNIVLFTTIDGSTWFDKHKESLPIHIEDHTLEFAGKTLSDGQCLSFIWPNPENPNHYVLYNIAKDLNGLKSLRHHSERNSLNPALRGDFVVYDRNGQPIWGGLFNKKWDIETKEIF